MDQFYSANRAESSPNRHRLAAWAKTRSGKLLDHHFGGGSGRLGKLVPGWEYTVLYFNEGRARLFLGAADRTADPTPCRGTFRGIAPSRTRIPSARKHMGWLVRQRGSNGNGAGGRHRKHLDDVTAALPLSPRGRRRLRTLLQQK